MSLRVRLIASIIIVLFVSLCVGAAMVGWHAVKSVRAEMQAALAIGAQTARNGIADAMPARDRNGELERLVHTLDGDRHIRAILRDTAERVRVASMPAAATPDVRHGLSLCWRQRSGRFAWMLTRITQSRSRPLRTMRSARCGRSFAMTLLPLACPAG